VIKLKTIAEGAPYYLATSIEQTPFYRFWVVLLENGLEVYQSCDDPKLEEPNSWIRLKQFCEDNDVKPSSMAFASADLNPHTQINLDPLADGYFYTKRIRKLIAANPNFSGREDHAQGVGQLYKDTLKIIWEFDDGSIEMEERNIKDNPKSNLISLIRK